MADEDKDLKALYVRLTLEDRERLKYIQRRRGIGNMTDAIRFSVAETADQLGYQEADRRDAGKERSA